MWLAFAYAGWLPVAAFAQVQPAKEPFPASWPAFMTSSNPEDKKLAQQVPAMEWFDACVAWGKEARKKPPTRRAQALKAYLLHDHTLNEVDLQRIGGQVPDIGMTTCGVLAMLGLPNANNVSRNSAGYSTQLVFRKSNVYVYTFSRTEDGNALVRSVQY